jgi:hypothetical protein
MYTKTLILFLLVVTASCKKENYDIEDLFPKYQPICDVWKPLTMSYDSMGVRVTTSIEYDRLVINDNLSYVIYYDQSDYVVEDGDVRIITQTDDKLEIDFAPDYPMTSSYAGSHIFSFSDVVLESLTDDEMILTTSECWLFQNVEFHFENY